MIITRTPLRISLGGGGTDLPSYYRSNGGGFLVAAAINRYVYVAVHPNFEPSVLLKYSKIENVERPVDVEHPLIREALIYTGVGPGIEISSMADIPAGTGLGSSGAFGVGLLRGLFAYQRKYVPTAQVAEIACHIEIERLREPVGKQDQYIAAIGGLTAFEFHPDDSVSVVALPTEPRVCERLDENLLLFYTGTRRSASAELRATDDAAGQAGHEMALNLDETKRSGRRTFDALSSGDLSEFAGLLTEQWEIKYRRSPSEFHGLVDGWIRAGLAAGAVGGKLVGAGGGGFLLFYAERKESLREAMRGLGLPEVAFSIEFNGTQVIVS